MADVKRVSQVNDKISALAHALDRLSVLVVELESRMSGVLRIPPPPMPAEEDMVCEPECLVPVAEELNILNLKAFNAERHLGDILNRIEL